MIEGGIIYGFFIHCVTSVLGVIGFACGMTAFGTGGAVWLSKIITWLLFVFYSPVLLAAKAGIVKANIGPFPSVGTVLWCFIVGCILWRVRKRIQNNKSEQVPSPEAQ